MRFSYNKLWKLLIDRGINKKALREMSGISAPSVAILGERGYGYPDGWNLLMTRRVMLYLY